MMPRVGEYLLTWWVLIRNGLLQKQMQKFPVRVISMSSWMWMMRVLHGMVLEGGRQSLRNVMFSRWWIFREVRRIWQWLLSRVEKQPGRLLHREQRAGSRERRVESRE